MNEMTAPQTKKQLPIAVGVIEHEGRFLITRRLDEISILNGQWEFPGGKIEFGETPVEGLLRELREETGLVVHSPELLGIHSHVWDLPDRQVQVFLMFYRVQADTDTVTLLTEENDAYQWVTLPEYLAIPNVLEANHEMVKRLYR